MPWLSIYAKNVCEYHLKLLFTGIKVRGKFLEGLKK